MKEPTAAKMTKRARAATLAALALPLDADNNAKMCGDEATASHPTVCSSSISTSGSTIADGGASKSCSTETPFPPKTDASLFAPCSYKDVLLQRASTASSTNLPIHQDNDAFSSSSGTLTPPLSPTDDDTGGHRSNNDPHDIDARLARMTRQDKTAAARLHTRTIRGAIAHASAQGVLSKSSKRELRQSMLRGQTRVVLEGLRQKCHLQPVVPPQPQPPASEFELRHTNGLLKCLHLHAPLQPTVRLAAKHLALLELGRVVDTWVPHASLFLGGSSYLKADRADSTLDVVVLCPQHVQATDFVTEFRAILARHDGCRDVAAAVAVDATHVPTLMCTFHGQSVALLFARFPHPVVPKHLPLHSDHILAEMDVASVRALSVPRLASLVLELVPNPTTFRTCLRTVRHWATARGLDAPRVGFLGGTAWTLLVAFVCQLFPNAVAASLVHHFFSVLAAWPWPTPLMLTKPYDAAVAGVVGQWNPLGNVHDRAHAMPILTPGYPATNAAATVTHSTLRVLREEFTRGKLLLDDMAAQGLSSPAAWTSLFAPSDFAVRYDHYLQVRMDVVAASADDDEATRRRRRDQYTAVVATKLRKLVDTLQHTAYVWTVHPFPTRFEEAGDACFYYVGFEVDPAVDADAAALVAPVLTYFVATELRPTTESGHATMMYRHWQDLPNSIFPLGRDHAAGDRAKYMLSRAHNLHVATTSARRHPMVQPPRPPPLHCLPPFHHHHS
ncbi:Aste57867_15467 [Aphanomyces stellatus]|uniref:polynucleotide adenylyltransferase n=1 Tax=Aphanomyces stellatus TaxID=120398 RepID=A0A485L371_9STRA|nr:hypothetical protein As57867_015411 [Aphanomyces stellatus]VFT92269.1 Aste57867_15467 [Aphanomyces stellatus]